MKLWHKVLVALVIGVIAGFLMNPQGPLHLDGKDGHIDGAAFLTSYVKPVGTLFIDLIKMVVIPLIFFSLISGICSMAEPTAFKRIGTKSVIWYLGTGTFAVCIGLLFGHIFTPGLGIDMASLSAQAGTDSPALVHALTVGKDEGIIHLIIKIVLDMVPTNIFAALASDDHILQIVVFAIFVAMTLNVLRDKVRNLIEVCHQAALLVFKMIETVIGFSPYGVLALTSWSVGTQGLSIVVALGKLALVVFGALFVQYLLFGVLLLFFGRLNPLQFYRKVLETQSLAFSTSSSKATLSTAMRVAHERLGVSRTSTSFVLPLGTSINMDGTAIYLGICALFFAQAYGIPLDAHDYLLLILTATLGSIGAAGIPGGSLIMMGMVLSSVHLPLEGMALILGIDRILDMMRTTINITGDTVITMLVDRSEGSFDEGRYNDPAV